MTTLPPIYNIAHPPSILIRDYLISKSIGVDPTTSSSDYPIYVSLLPDADNVKDKALAVIDTTPVYRAEWSRNGQLYPDYGIQILIRDNDYPTGFSKMKDALDALDEIKYTLLTHDSIQYKMRYFRRVSEIPIGQEDDNRRRQLFSINGLFSVIDNTK